MVFSLLEEEKVKWKKVGMRAEDITWIEEASKARWSWNQSDWNL